MWPCKWVTSRSRLWKLPLTTHMITSTIHSSALPCSTSMSSNHQRSHSRRPFDWIPQTHKQRHGTGSARLSSMRRVREMTANQPPPPLSPSHHLRALQTAPATALSPSHPAPPPLLTPSTAISSISCRARSPLTFTPRTLTRREFPAVSQRPTLPFRSSRAIQAPLTLSTSLM